MMVITILEARVEPAKWSALQSAYKKGTAGQLPSQMIQTFLIQSMANKMIWQIVSVWKSREALDEMKKSVETPAGVLMFRAAEAEPTLTVYEVCGFAP
jgi:quinol monooxygenase YgiN